MRNDPDEREFQSVNRGTRLISSYFVIVGPLFWLASRGGVFATLCPAQPDAVSMNLFLGLALLQVPITFFLTAVQAFGGFLLRRRRPWAVPLLRGSIVLCILFALVVVPLAGFLPGKAVTEADTKLYIPSAAQMAGSFILGLLNLLELFFLVWAFFWLGRNKRTLIAGVCT
jgi:hypothetical protein